MPPDNREPATRGRGRVARAGRGGRGRGSGRANAAVSSASSSRHPRGGSRRGRAKVFNDINVQAAYERMREIKDLYIIITNASIPLQVEMIDRELQLAADIPGYVEGLPCYEHLLAQLETRYEGITALATRRWMEDQVLVGAADLKKTYIINEEFRARLKDLLSEWYDDQAQRGRLLASLHQKELPVDLSDERYEFRKITDEQLDNDINPNAHGPVIPKDGAGASASASASASATAPTTRGGSSGRGRGRGAATRRRTQDKLDSQPAAAVKKNTRSTAETELAPPAPAPATAPSPATGLLAAAAAAEQRPEALELQRSVVDSVSQRTARVAEKDNARSGSPPLPRTAGPPDELGFRIVNARPRENGPPPRICAPAPFEFEDHEIGFRDSTNCLTYGSGRNKRSKYFNSPNTSRFYYDTTTLGHSYSDLKPEDFDQELVQRFGLHPQWGVFMATSTNKAEPTTPYVMPGKPVVYVGQPSGRIHHASRGFHRTINERSAAEAPLRASIARCLRSWCRQDGDVSKEDLVAEGVLPSDQELRERSLGTASGGVTSGHGTEELLDESGERNEPEKQGLLTLTEARGGSDETIEAPPPAEEASGILHLIHAGAFLEASEGPSRPPSTQPVGNLYDPIRNTYTGPLNDVSFVDLRLLSALGASLPRMQDAAPTPKGNIGSGPAPAVPVEPPVSARRVSPAPPPTTMASPTIPTAPDPLSRSTLARASTPFGAGPFGLQAAPGPRGRRPRNISEPVNGFHHDSTSPYALNSSTGPVHGPVPEPSMYQPTLEPVSALTNHHPLMRPVEYPSLPPSHHSQEQRTTFYNHHVTNSNGQYPASSSPRDTLLPPARPMEPSYGGSGARGDRRMSAYGTESQGPMPPHTPGHAQPPAAYSHHPSFWTQRPSIPQAPPAPQPAAPPPHPPPSQHFEGGPVSTSKMPFTLAGMAEPLPPMRSDRGRPEEPLMQEVVMPAVDRYMIHYPPPPPHMTGQEPFVSSMPPAQHYAGQPGQPGPPLTMPPPPPPQAYAHPTHQMMSPEFAGRQGPMGVLMASSPPPTHRHSGSVPLPPEAQRPLRRLQPAPVPPHRANNAPPELRTIPYDHNQSALPTAGSISIRGWNVNQIGRRSRPERVADVPLPPGPDESN